MEPFYLVFSILLIAAFVVFVMMWMHERKRRRDEEKHIAARETDLTMQLQQKQREMAELTEKVGSLREKCAGQLSQINYLIKKEEEQKEELEKLQASFRNEFRNLAAEMLEERSAQFKQTNMEAMESLLKPFKHNISEFKERVETIFTHSTEKQGELKAELGRLIELNRRITEETGNLTSALKGNSKVQGDWGEAVLETILEGSNLKKGIHYHTQKSIKNEERNELRPDVIILMPDGKQIVVDSKVSLRDFVRYSEAAVEEERKQCLEAHQKAVRAHVTQLSGKNYQQLLQASPDFVIMFVASEPAFLSAMQSDSTLWSYAYERKVIISSPTNLFAMLKIVDDLWKRDTQSKNAIAIAQEGAKLYDKFVGFYDTLEKLGRDIRSVSDGYHTAMNQLKDGRGSLISRTEKMRKLGLKATKALPEQVIDEAETEEDNV